MPRDKTRPPIDQPANLPGRRRRKLLLVLVLAALWGGYALYHWFQNEVTVVNRTAASIPRVSIEVSGQTIVFDKLGAGERRTSVLKITGDSSIVARVEHADGAIARAQGGYVTGGMHGVRIEVAIMSAGVTIVQH